MKKIASIALLLLLICSALQLASLPMTGEVVSIADDDTITILRGKTQHQIGLYGIDTPEKSQAFGKAAKKYISKLVVGKTVEVIPYDTDKHGRMFGVVVANGVNVNQRLISAGYAWQYRKYCKASFCNDWLHLEKKRRESGIGLWSEADPVPPWQWSRGARDSSYSQIYTGRDAGNGFQDNLNSHVFHSTP